MVSQPIQFDEFAVSNTATANDLVTIVRNAGLPNTSIRLITGKNLLNSVGNTLPTYSNNANALSGGLTVGTVYKTATGEIRIVV